MSSRIPNRKSSATTTGILLVVVAAITLVATSFIQYYYSKREFRKEASLRAESQLESTENRIMDVINQTEAAVRNSVWITRWCLNYPDSLPSVCSRVVKDNPVVMGSTVSLVPGYNRKRPLYAPYVYRKDSSLIYHTLASKEYDYPSKEWFTKPIENGGGYWSEPYVDTGGGEVLMTTFSIPVQDAKGVTAAVLTADISLDWLTDLVGNIRVYPNANSLIISRTGRFMVSKNRELVMQKTVGEVVEQIRNNESFKELNRAMLAGETGNMALTFQGQKSYVYYRPVERTGWSMCIVIPENDIFGQIRRTELLVRLFQLLGLIMLILILRSFFKKQSQYKELDERRERMQRELQIASNIQMSMVPTSFPERTDLDMAATIVPAKEVGGDLYDFFIRDDKLFFCIGDVSGKGIPASLVMAVTRTSFRNVAARQDRPGLIVSAMNDSLSSMNDNNMFVTFFCGVLDLKKGYLRYCNAGHNPPLLLTDAIRKLKVEPNLPLGIILGMDYVEQEIPFRYDDALLLYTDGLTEAENTLHEQFGDDRLQAALHGRKEAVAHLETIKQQISVFVDGAPQSDDLTMLFIHYLGEKGTVPRRLTLHNDIKQISQLPGFIRSVTAERNIPPELLNNINLALEEAVTNIILYAYPKGTDGLVDIDARADRNTLSFILSDSGKEFDPTAREEVDISAGVNERAIGGLGIHLVRSIMDSVRYERKDGKNILILTKHI